MEIITSRGNARLKHLCKLIDDKDYRYTCGEYVVEGRRALSACSGVKALYLRAGVIAPMVGCDSIFFVEEKLFATIAPTENSQGILAIVPLRISGPDAIKKTARYVFLDHLKDPGNAGTIIRSACAFGIDGVIVTPGCVDPFSPKVVRSSAGMVSSIEIIRIDNLSSLDSCFVLALAAGGQDVRTVSWPAWFVLAVGSEDQGVAPELRGRAQVVVGIPMQKSAESINAAVAAGIALFAAYGT
ncbi:MAG: RNA methyltransferase [Endomicrobiales bacterium]|jgi:TrmH family RNA methyltransferase